MNAQKKVAGWLVGAAGLLILGACAGGTVQVTSVTTGVVPEGGFSNCRTANWYNVGFEDGGRGFPTERIETYRCPAIARAETVNAYRAGWNDGIARYCTEQNGFVVAANGQPNAGTCPRALAREHRRGRRLGTRVFEQNQLIEEDLANEDIFNRNLRSGRFTPTQRERLIADRRQLQISRAAKQQDLEELLARARQRGYPIQ